ncbi:hypothetical protein SAMN04489760_11146 [Syntrophus gentianae]|uniref:Uncharacterized protein n=1 Tax=Syntrophus gentianae TaxID=43775 RepID=A0A1H7XMC0_9BACT|nr:hypothetical protein SAMN04489760_11146 [Syntrophus gentianae]
MAKGSLIALFDGFHQGIFSIPLIVVKTITKFNE